MNSRGISSPRLLLALVGIACALAVAGAVSFIRYGQRAVPDARRVAVAPFDIFAAGHDVWRVQLARRVTDRIAAQPGWSAVPQEVVAQIWKGQDRAEAAAVELGRRTQAALSVYGRVDTVGRDSLRIHALLIDNHTTVVSQTVELWLARRDTAAMADLVAGRIAAALPTAAP